MFVIKGANAIDPDGVAGVMMATRWAVQQADS